jgi:hypothetical protein
MGIPDDDVPRAPVRISWIAVMNGVRALPAGQLLCSALRNLACLLAVAVVSAVPVVLGLSQTVGPDKVLLLDMPILAQGDTRQLPLLASGAMALPTSCQTCSVAATQYRIWVPSGVVRLVLEVASDAGATLCLAVRSSVPVLEDADYVYFSYSSCGQPAPLRLAIGPEGGSGLTAGAYYIAILGGGEETNPAYELRGALYVSELPPGVSMEVSRTILLSEEKYTHGSGRFSLSYPLGWEAVSTASLHANVLAAFTTPATASDAGEALLEIGGWAMTVPRTAAEVFERLSHAYVDTGLFTLLGDVQETTLDGMSAVVAVFVGSPMTTLLACAADGLYAWLLTLTFQPTTTFPLYEAAFLMAVESFHRGE